MISKTNYSPIRAAVQVVIILTLLVSLLANVKLATAATAPKNDDFYQAVKFTASVRQTVADINLATSDPDDPPLNCDGGGANFGEATVWYTFTPSSAGQLVASTAGSGYDTIITVFRAIYYYDPEENPSSWSDPWDLEELGCNDNAGALTTTSKLEISLRGDTVYYIEVARKTGTAVSAPDPLKFSAKYTNKTIAHVNIYDALQGLPFYLSSKGWTPRFILPGITYNNNIAVGNNVGDTATVFYDGDPLELCYVKGPDMGTLDITIDGQSVGSINQGSSVYTYDCTQFFYEDHPNPDFSEDFRDDMIHKLVMKHAGPGGTKVNVDTIEVVSPPLDFEDPDPIWDLDLPYKYYNGTNPPDPPTSQAVMQWTAPGDDWGPYGHVNHYEVRYITDADWVANGSNDPWDDATWDAATPITTGVPEPLLGGKWQTMTVNGLPPGTYHFNVIGVDDVGNPIMPCGFCYSNDYEYTITTWGPGVYGPGTYDDRFVGLKYTGRWKNVASPDNIKNTIRLGTKVGSAVQFTFTGTQFRYYYNRGPSLGSLDVYLDGAFLTTIDEYAPYPIQWTYVSPMLTYGPHTIKFVMTTLKYVVIDAIQISGFTDGGAPDPIADLTADPGLTDGSVDLSWTASGDDPGDPPGVGTAAKYEVRYSLDPIVTELDWLLADPAPGVVPVPQENGSDEYMTVTGLVPGFNYWFAVRATDDAGYSVLSNTTIGQAAIVPEVWADPGYYEDSDFTNGTWRYYGSWVWDNSLPEASNSDEHIGGAGNAAAFLYHGTGFTLTYQTRSNFGTMKIYVDGVQVGVIDQHNSRARWQQTFTYSAGGVADDHTVEFVLVGRGNIDALTILP